MLRERLRPTLITALFTVALSVGLLGGCAQSVPVPVFDDPYAEVDWDAWGRYKANFHAHTTRSDGAMHPHDVIDRYHEMGYSVLAITDHNRVTYPWTNLSDLEPSRRAVQRHEEGKLDSLTYENRDPQALNMVAIEGNELSSHHHMGSFFNDHNGTNTEEASLEAVGAKDGLAMLYHPGRYDKPVEWYVDLYERHDHLFGLEVYNQGDRYKNDRELWDAILVELMPHRPVWGYSDDDMHVTGHLGRNWNVLLLPGLSPEAVREGMQRGLSYYVYAPGGHNGASPPVVEAVRTDARTGTIRIEASGFESILWISNGQVVHQGEEIVLGDVDDLGTYVRAELHGAEGTVVGLQPFGIHKPQTVSSAGR